MDKTQDVEFVIFNHSFEEVSKKLDTLWDRTLDEDNEFGRMIEYNAFDTSVLEGFQLIDWNSEEKHPAFKEEWDSKITDKTSVVIYSSKEEPEDFLKKVNGFLNVLKELMPDVQVGVSVDYYENFEHKKTDSIFYGD